MNEDEIEAWIAATQWQGQWGKEYDVDLMNTLLRLDEAEDGMGWDWQDIERRIEAGALTREDWDREAAERDLASARDGFWIAKERLARDHTPAEVYKIISDHYERIGDYRVYGRPAKVETTIVTQLVGFLTRADRAVPCVTRVADLVESLKACAPLFMPETGDDEKRKLMEDYALRPLLRTIENLAGLSGPGERVLAQEFKEVARRIHKEGLFKGDKSNIEKKIRAAGLPLKGGVDKSSSLYSNVRPANP